MLEGKEMLGVWFRGFFLSMDGSILVVYRNDGSWGHPVLEKGLRIFVVNEVTQSAGRQCG